MRLFGHPVHVMLIHFPVALWPAHWVFHVLSGRLPAGVAALAGFWILVAGCAIGWLAVVAGLTDLLVLSRENNPKQLDRALLHAAINGTVLVLFSAAAAMEYASYPQIAHGVAFLSAEAVVLAALFVGNYCGGAIVWAGPAGPDQPPPR